AVGQSDFYQVFSAYGPPVDMSNREGTGSSREHVYYSNGLFLDLSLNDSSQKWIVNHANIRSSEYWPPRSVKVGDPVTEMFKFFGDGYNQIGNRYYYTILSNYWEQRGIVFTVEDKKIAEIDIYNRAIPKKSAQ
ncbi:MAG: hypothetical protein N3A57_06615, partial [Negativicutes bacterium]|nr:hypothetical protein [Negativicutes bacterium]